MRWGYFPAVFLFAAFRLEPEGAAGEAGGIEIALGADALEVEHAAHSPHKKQFR
jgi:hypothetical protein